MAGFVQLVLCLISYKILIGFPEFRVFPYENASPEPFEISVAALNPVVAIKVRRAAVHAALAEVYVLLSCLIPWVAPFSCSAKSPHSVTVPLITTRQPHQHQQRLR